MKAVGLFSGGLDSILACKLIQEQGIDVIAVSFKSPFFINEENIKKIAKENSIELKIIDISEDYIKMVRKPKHGYGKNMNPCIDCKIFMIKKAKEYADKIKARFIFTGEVMGQRPMSQLKNTLKLIEKESGLKGKLLRPLSAKVLDETEIEKDGTINRNKLLDLEGRGRKNQLRLAKKYNIKGYSTPAGGCLLTYSGYCNKLKDLFRHKGDIDVEDIRLLKVGRHFRVGKAKIIVGRNKEDNKELEKARKTYDLLFDVKDAMSPITLLSGEKNNKIIGIAASLTARYCDSKDEKVIVKYGMGKFNKEMIVEKIKEKEIEKIRLN
ncbi:MAG: tRNA 4-thiouridine(8) synthase ThiI [Nanoarchaeota archaeon]